MSYTTAEGRERILQDLAEATDQIELALGYLSDAYELVDVNIADQLEERLFGPVQAALARSKRTHAEFGRRSGVAASQREAPAGGHRPHGARDLLEATAEALEQSDHWIAELQGSMLPVEVGDPELRSGLSETRTLIDPLPARARELVRTLGR
jgi:regulator of protease activity HflC (stomatin/prohibitin superfamily)